MSERPNNPPIVVGLGEVLWDMLPAGKQLGGAPANFAYHAQQLGARAAIVSAVGKDALGDELLAQLRSVGLDTSHIAVLEDRPTGTVSVTLDAAGVPSYVIHENVAWDFIPSPGSFAPLAYEADAICFGSIAQRSPVSRKTIGEYLSSAVMGNLSVFDINLRQQYYNVGIIRGSLLHANVLKINDQEIHTLGGLLEMPPDENVIIATLLEHTRLKLIAVTRGDKGSSLFTPHALSHHPGYMTKIVDTVGAGDAFTAALVIGVLRGDPLDKINADANRLASFVCSQAGAMPSYSGFR